MYSIASAYFDPAKISAFDIDENALQVARENLDHYELTETVDLKHLDILKSGMENQFDTVIMNPPFGTKNNEGVDMELLMAACKALKPGGQVFSLHKASTKAYIEKFIREKVEGCEGEMLNIINFDLPKTYKF